MWTRAELKMRAKQKLSCAYWSIVGITFLANLVMGMFDIEIPADAMYEQRIIGEDIYLLLLMVNLAIAVGSLFLTIFVFNPLKVGLNRYYLNLETRSESWSDIFYPFKNHYWNVVGVVLLMNIKIFLWALLFIIPGFVKAYEYRMIPYLLAEDSSLKAGELFNATRNMMTGEKADAFVLDLSFLGWFILYLFTAGLLGLFFVEPYYNLTCTELYRALKDRVDYLFDDYRDTMDVIM